MNNLYQLSHFSLLRAIETAYLKTAGVLLTNGAVYCWGDNTVGTIGNGSATPLESTPYQTIASGSGLTALAGSYCGFAAVSATGQTKVWGFNDIGTYNATIEYGLLGVCSPVSLIDTPTTGPSVTAGSSVSGFDAFGFMAVTPGNQLQTWGYVGLPYYDAALNVNFSATMGCPATPLPNAYPARPNGEPLPINPTVTLNTTSVTLCAGSSVILQASGGYGTPFTWSPNIGLSATTGTTVVVSPNSTQQYTVSSPNPCGGPARTATVVVEVKENCCQAEDGTDLDIASGTYTSSPFAGQPGTRYHVGGDLLLLNDTYVLEAGQTLLMPPDAVLTVGTDADLQLNGATITAACDEMWGRLVVAGDARGLATTSTGTLRSRIQHCREGVVLEESSAQAYFQLRNTDFLHNGVSLSLHRAQNGATSDDYVRRCLFDSTPEYFKAPLSYNGPNDHYYTQHHLYLAGDFLPAAFVRNRLNHCVFGVVGSTVDGEAASIEMATGEFSDCYVAGAYNTTNPGYDPTWTFIDNVFQFPAEEALPATPQIDEALQLATNGVPETYGVFVGNEAAVRATGNVFKASDNSVVRLTDSYDQFGQANPRQVGIHGNVLPLIEGNIFDNLETGVEQTARPGDASELLGNTFRECRVGWDISPVGNVFSGPPYGSPEPELNATCNSFLRDDYRDGTSTGIHMRNFSIAHSQPGMGIVYYHPEVLLRHPNGDPLKNLFDDAGRSPGEFWAIDNEQGGNPLDYYTYNDYYLQVQDYSAGNVTVPSNGPSRNVFGQSSTRTCEYVLGYFDVGLQARGSSPTTPSGPVKAELSQNWPNPCAGSTTFHYAAPPKTQQAELLIRRSMDGREIDRVKLNPQATEATITVRDWSAGTYFATLVVDGVPGKTRRMVVK